MEPPPSANAPDAQKRKLPVWKIAGFLLVGLLYLIFTAPRNSTAPGEVVNGAVSKAEAVAAILAKYAADHGGKYPEGATSTKVFQALIDQGYIDDTSILYYPMPGKAPAVTKQLTPANVCWDLTSGVDTLSPSALPVVFSTGFAVAFQPGARPGVPPISWWNGWNDHTHARDFIALCDHGGTGRSIYTGLESELSFLPAEMNLNNRTYRQLTPDGKIPPLQ